MRLFYKFLVAIKNMSTILHFITGIRQLWYTLKQKLTAQGGPILPCVINLLRYIFI